MKTRLKSAGVVLVLAAGLVAADVIAQSSVSYGRITAVRQVDIRNQGAQNAGTLIGGAVGVASGSGQSRSNRALRGVGGATVGNRIARSAGSSTGFEYTVLIGGSNTIRITTDQSGMRVGDCVSVERGQFNNIRLAAEDRCNAPAAARPPASAVSEADACDTAKQQLLDATTDAEFEMAERRMRLLCN